MRSSPAEAFESGTRKRMKPTRAATSGWAEQLGVGSQRSKNVWYIGHRGRTNGVRRSATGRAGRGGLTRRSARDRRRRRAAHGLDRVPCRPIARAPHHGVCDDPTVAIITIARPSDSSNRWASIALPIPPTETSSGAAAGRRSRGAMPRRRGSSSKSHRRTRSRPGEALRDRAGSLATAGSARRRHLTTVRDARRPARPVARASAPRTSADVLRSRRRPGHRGAPASGRCARARPRADHRPLTAEPRARAR